MENLTLKIEISYNEIRKMVARINGEVWDDKTIKEYFSKRKTLEISKSEIDKLDKEAFICFTALAVSIVEFRKKPKKKSKFEERLEAMEQQQIKKR